jgi:2-polyprenyl-6-methoxyphenol hydroxylase-like FAD-dependent oxidoreductase
VNEKNEKVGGFNLLKLRSLIQYRHFNLLRSNLEKILFEAVKDNVQIIFSDSIRSINPSVSGANVTFESGSHAEFSIVIGADGLHSNVRNLTFGTEEKFEKYLGYYAASFTIDNYLNEDHIAYSYSIPEKQISLYSLRENKLATLFVFKSTDKVQEECGKETLRTVYRNAGWECPRLFEAMNHSPDFYFDRVSQIQLDQWSRGPVVLVGDACQCVSLIAGQGSSLAMAGAYILAGELKEAGGDIQKAFHNYEEILKPEIERKQRLASDFASSFVPETKFAIWKRNKFTNLMLLPFVSRWFINKYLSDKVRLKSYFESA